MAGKPRLTWSRKPRQRGLAGVVQGERGYDLKINGEIMGRVRPLSVGHHRYDGYYWYARSDKYPVPLRSTCGAPVSTMDEAKAQCEAYVRQCLSDAASTEGKGGTATC